MPWPIFANRVVCLLWTPLETRRGRTFPSTLGSPFQDLCDSLLRAHTARIWERIGLGSDDLSGSVQGQ